MCLVQQNFLHYYNPCIILSSSKGHVLFLQWQEELYPGKRIKELKIRGSAKEKAVEAIDLFLRTKALSDILQKPNLDLATASTLILSTKSTLQGSRFQETWHHVYQYVLQVSAHLNIAPNLPCHSTQRRPKSLQNFVISETSGSR